MSVNRFQFSYFIAHIPVYSLEFSDFSIETLVCAPATDGTGLLVLREPRQVSWGTELEGARHQPVEWL